MPGIINKPPLTIDNITYEIKEGILFIKRSVRVQYTAETLNAHVMDRLAYTEGFSFPLVIYGQDMVSMDKPARDFMVGECAKNTLSRAFVVEKPQGRLQLNFFTNTYKQPVPTEIFDSLEQAIEWSKQFSRILDI